MSKVLYGLEEIGMRGTVLSVERRVLRTLRRLSVGSADLSLTLDALFSFLLPGFYLLA
jgi:hypothetical protein